ncbi:MAG: type II secretion system F family protein [Phycisphaerae bacterium]|nr:type II secretion system F family protein [Phycisphaerae bacterium]
MPTFEAIQGNLILLIVTILSIGVFVGLGLFLLMRIVPEKLGVGVGVISESQRRMRRTRSAGSSGLFGLILPMLPALAAVTSKVPGIDVVRKDLTKNYARAGWPGGLTDDELVAMSLLVGAVLCVPLGALFALYDPFLAPLGIVGLLMGPGLVSTKLMGQGKVRDNAIIRVMPFVLDLLVLSLRAGASLSVAMDIVAKDYAGHPLGEEFRATLKDIEMGTTLKTAFENLSNRVPSHVIRTFVDEVIQSEELGRPIAGTLERLSDRVRVNRVQDATNVAGKAKVMVLVPGLLVLLATLIVLFTPWIVKFQEEGVSLSTR